jgi:membrane-associated phospholipid phosphatase
MSSEVQAVHRSSERDRVSRVRLADLPQPRSWILWPLSLAVLTLALGFVVKLVPKIATTEFRVDQAFSRHHDVVLNAIALAINAALAPVGIVVILTILFLFLLLVARSPVNAVAVCSVTVVGWLSSEAFKLIVAEPRPNEHNLAHPLIASDGSGSFPSGHTTFAVSLAIALYFLARRTRWSKIVFISGLVFAVAVAVSRLYLGVHYPSDVLGSFLVAATSIALFTGLWNKYAIRILNGVPFLDRLGPIPTSPTISHVSG